MKTYKKTHSLSLPKINFEMTVGKIAVIGFLICVIPTILLCFPSLFNIPNFNIEPLIWLLYIVGGFMGIGCGIAWFADHIEGW